MYRVKSRQTDVLHHRIVIDPQLLRRAMDQNLHFPIFCQLFNGDKSAVVQVDHPDAQEGTVELSQVTKQRLDVQDGDEVMVIFADVPQAEHVVFWIDDQYAQWSEEVHRKVEKFLSRHGALHVNEQLPFGVANMDIRVSDLGTDSPAVKLGECDVKFDYKLPERTKFSNVIHTHQPEEFSDSSDDDQFVPFSGMGRRLCE